MRRIALFLGAVVGVGLCLSLAFTLDQRAHADRVARNVVLHDDPIGGMERDEVSERVERLAQEAQDAALTVKTAGDGTDETYTMTFDAEEIELMVDVRRTVDAVMRTGRQANLATRLFSWMLSPLRPRDAGVAVSADHDSIYELVAERDTGREPPTEPTIRGDEHGVEVVPGEPGQGIDAADVISGLPAAARRGFPMVVEVERGEVRPRHSLSQARATAERAEALTSEPVRVKAAGETRTIPVEDIRSWLDTSKGSADLRPTFNDAKTIDTLQTAFEGLGREPVDATFAIGAGGVILRPGREGTKCCAGEAVDLLEAQVLDRAPATDLPDDIGPLPLVSVPPKRGLAEARALNIGEQVGGFTTQHKAGEPRVRNIHRIADLMRGVVIEPGETMSVNGVVGKRTAERGFVPAPVIEEGSFSEDVGGGISQFATTLFNAAFFAGLEFPEYQSHSIYISRYPYGREATLSFPKPDLKIRNQTEYGVLIWTSYTETSISVSLWSTKHIDAAQTDQTRSPRGPCTFVRTERTRTYPDGGKRVDHVNALYRPAEGVQC
ncbi:MAG: VanW family protein [Actinobacteria bacterium]|nr:VanW family protein [Actinomycetota bacterium]